MEVAMPVSNSGGSSAMDSYEDMFKEITRKLYGEDGLPDIIAGEKLTNLPSTSDRNISNVDYEVDSTVFKPDEHITAFGLAALMQNGFTSGTMLNSSFPQVNKSNMNTEDKWFTSDDTLQWTQSKIASYNPSQKLFKCTECECVGFLTRVAEHWLGTHANLRVFQCPQCPYASAWARCVRMHVARQHNLNTEENLDTMLKDNPVMSEIARYLQNLKSKYDINTNPSTKPLSTHSSEGNKPQINSPQRMGNSTVQNLAENNGAGNNIATKRYTCNYCPYATDRRDLFTRHENIHREEKPFQCYVCQKQFNRADHVKKHFLRMHREHPYDLNRIRRQPPKNASGMSYYNKYNNPDTQINPPNEPSNIQAMQHQLTIPNGFNVMNRSTPTAVNKNGSKTSPVKLNSNKSSCKKKSDKRYSCCYCSWSGVDNWCLKRHLNTHLKPYICGLCDYKAARSERLATHVLKVHNKRACGRCLFLADDQTQLMVHQQEHHSLEQRNNKSSNNILRNAASFPTTHNPTTQTFSQSHNTVTPALKSYDLSAAILQHGSRLLPMSTNFLANANSKPWKTYAPKQHGAARLFNYMEASDGSDPECDTSNTTDDTSRLNNTSTRDFLETEPVGNTEPEELEEDMELPLFMCRECGCEFIDDISLETHIYTHHQVEKIPTFPINKTTCKKNPKSSTTASKKSNAESKENLNPKPNYICMICKINFTNQINIMNHMKSHINLTYKKREVPGKKTLQNKRDYAEESTCYQNSNGTFKRSRKQSQPRKVVAPPYENQEIQVLKGSSLKNRQWSRNNHTILRLREKYVNRLITRKGYYCNLCKKGQSLFPYHTKTSLSIHFLYQHKGIKRFECEHCSEKFRHRYQVVLHSSRAHTNMSSQSESDKSVPKVTKDILCSVPAQNSQTDSLMTTPVPDNSSMCVEKINIHSFLENSIINPTSNLNNNMPITIPTFPPS